MNRRLDGISGVYEWEIALEQSRKANAIPNEVQDRLDRTYASLRGIPQEAPIRARRFGRGAVVAIAVAAMTLFAGVAFASTNLLQIGSGSTDFFEGNKNLPVFSSMEASAKTLTADIGQSVEVDGIHVTLDSITCDRSVANLYLTLSKEDGFDLNDLKNYDGSQEGEWARLQNAIPIMRYTITSDDGVQGQGDIRRLDAYRDGQDIKCLMRLIPQNIMPDKVEIDIECLSALDDQESTFPSFCVGLDMEDVAEPQDIASQDIVFNTEQGAKTLSLQRFTKSELACVLVTNKQETTWIDKDDTEVIGTSKDFIDPALLKISDDQGNVLQPVEPGDGNGYSANEACVIEYANMSPFAQNVTFTPILANDTKVEEQRLARAEQYANTNSDSANDDVAAIDIANVNDGGIRINTSPLGGYNITGWEVEDSTVTISMTPFGWNLNVPELMPSGDVPSLSEEWVDLESGETGVGEHVALRYMKWDYETGKVLQIDSYYNAPNEQLQAITNYTYSFYPDWFFSEDTDAARTLALA